MILLFANNAVSTIASPINAAATAVQLAAGDGNKFPNPVVGQQFFKLTFVDAATGLVNEIVNVTQRVGDVLTIVRAQEGTLARPWLAGDSAKNMTTAQTQANFIQVQQAQDGDTNAAIDTGTPNSYVVALTPAVTNRHFGRYARIKAANTNTGPSTLNMGAGSFPILNPDGTDLGANAIVANGFFEVVDDGVAAYQLISASQELQSGAGLATTGDVKWRPTNETISGYVVANTRTIGGPNSNAAQLASETAENLFTWHWNNFPNTQCPVFTSAGVPTTRGANPGADFAAGKQIATYDMVGMMPIGVDAMGAPATGRLNGVPVTSGSLTAPGSVIGENLHTLITAELASHVHSSSLSDPTHTHSSNAQVFQNQAPTEVQTTFTVQFNFTTATINPNFTGVSLNNAAQGGGQAHNNVSRSAAGFWYLKL
jgi:hypothetical protein